MINLGPRSAFEKLNHLEKVRVSGRPDKMLDLQEGEAAVCGRDPGTGEVFVVFFNLEEMRCLYDSFTKIGYTINWYILKKYPLKSEVQ